MPTPHLLLFGSPGAGKTSLLGALAHAVGAPGSALKGQLLDPSGAWSRLQSSTYDSPIPATDKLAAYDFKLQLADNNAAPVEVKILDCSGKSAAQMLNAAAPFADAHPLQKSVLAADAILVLVDMSQPLTQLGEEFRRFGKWLTELHQTRGKLALIGDLPIYLVLTKCDALVKKDDTASQWKLRLEEAKRQVDEQFRKFLKEEGENFGSLDVTIWATAIKRPAFSDGAVRSQEPYGVAELFRLCLESAGDFVERRQISQSRLYNIVVGLMGSVALLALSLALLVEYQPDTKWATLDEQVQTVLPRPDAKPPQRLGGTLKKLEEKHKRLADIASDPEYTHLPQDSRDRVQRYRDEIDQYLQLERDSRTKVKFPFLAKTEEEFIAQQKSLGELKYPDDWHDTQVGRRAQQAAKEYEAVNKALKERAAWMQEQTKTDNVLLTDGTKLQVKLRENTKLGPQEVELWNLRYRNQMQARPAALQSDPIPGVSGVTYEFLDKFQSIKDARKRWDAVKTQLKRVADNIDELKTGT